jgi:hypothetical protein
MLMQMPAVELLVLAIALGLIFACGGQSLVHRAFNRHDFVQHNEVGGFIIAVAGTLYAVLLGFLTVVAWQHFADARQHVTIEAAAATDSWHAAVGLPAAQRARVRNDLLQYAELMVNREWPELRAGRFEKNGDVIIMDAIGAAGTFNPASAKESNSQTVTLTQLGQLHDARLRRLTDNEVEISGFEWVVLFIGAICIICFCWLFGLQNRYVHLLMTSAVAIIITAMLVLLFELQSPFRSYLRIGPDTWAGVIAHIHAMQGGRQMEMR